MGGMSIGNLPNQSILKKINDIAADVNDLDLEGVNNLKSKLSELVAPELGSSDTKAISQKVVTENIERLNTEVNNKINKVESAQNGNLPSFDNGYIKDSKIPASNIAQANGYYESMIVGASRNLAGNNVVTAKYTYRPTADTTDVVDGVAKISSVKGNTIVWNQKVQLWRDLYNTSLIYKEADGALYLNGSARYMLGYNNIAADNSGLAVVGHKYYVKIKIKDIVHTDCYIIHCNICSSLPMIVSDLSSTYENSSIITCNYDRLGYISGLKEDKSFSSAWSAKLYYTVIDLTQMFGKGNEPTIEEFEAMFPNDYYEYNEGELRSIEDFQIKSVGFNQLDEEWVGGGVKFDGTIRPDSNRRVTKNFIRVIPNKKYKITLDNAADYYWAEFDSDFKNILSENSYLRSINNNKEGVTFKGHYIKITGPKDNQTVNINLSHSGIRNGEYEPYQEDILPINISTIKDENGEQLFPNGLCSAGEAHDELIYDKGIGKWKAIKRIGSVDLGTLNWIYYDVNYNPNSFPYGFFTTGDLYRKQSLKNIVLTKYPFGGYSKDKTMLGNASNQAIYIIDSAYTDAAALKASLQGQILYYELAEPIEVVLDDFSSNYKVSDWGTEEILMNSTPVIPVIYDVEYALNAVDTLRNMPTNYISKESLDAFLSALGSAMGGTWTATWNEDMQKYTFNFTPNAVNVE